MFLSSLIEELCTKEENKAGCTLILRAVYRATQKQSNAFSVWCKGRKCFWKALFNVRENFSILCDECKTNTESRKKYLDETREL